jgi:adenylate cyclase
LLPIGHLLQNLWMYSGARHIFSHYTMNSHERIQFIQKHLPHPLIDSTYIRASKQKPKLVLQRPTMNTQIEIERKFLVKHTRFLDNHEAIDIIQGYIISHPQLSCRIRIAKLLNQPDQTQCVLSVKVSENDSLTVRKEYEIEVSQPEAMDYLHKCDHVVHKIRHLVPYEGHIFEVDEFLDENQGLVIAELELDHQQQPFPIPEWLGEDVSDNPRYLNTSLATHPFSSWKV